MLKLSHFLSIKVGGKRCHDLEERKCLMPQLGSGGDSTTSGSGHFSVNDFQDILREASKRYIDVIPEIDMPAHSRAAIKAMEARYFKYISVNQTLANQYRLIDPNDTSRYVSAQIFNDNVVNPCIETTYAFVEKVVSEIKKMYEGEGIRPLTYFHYGGDEMAPEAWVNSSVCEEFTKENPYYNTTRHRKEYFVRRVATIAHDLKLNLAGWEDGLIGDDEVPYNRSSLPNSEVYGNAWQNIWEWGVGGRAYNLANNGYKVLFPIVCQSLFTCTT
jgi:hexosaminidase